jgi:gliding motility-associated-like protein
MMGNKFEALTYIRVMRHYIVLILLFASFVSEAQFSNPSFEQNTAMPQLLGEWNKVIGWTNAGSDVAVPDYYKVGASASCDLPETPYAILNAQNGNAVMGVQLCGRQNTNKRAYLQTQLQSPLVRGKKYKFSFYLSNGRLTPTSNAGLAIDRVGVYISSFAPVQTGYDPLYFIPQFAIDTVFYSETWRKVSFEYVPLIDDEKFITLGVFGSDSDREIVIEGSGNPEVGYYFVDNFSCIEIDGDNVPDENPIDKGPAPEKVNYVFVPNSFTPNGDGQNDVFMPVGEAGNIISVEVFSRWGEILFQSKNVPNPMWDGTNGKGVCPDGTYYYVIKYSIPKTGEEGTQSGYVTLLR